MNTQTAINFDLAEPDITSLVGMVLALLKGGQWYTPWELCEEIWRTRGIRVSDSTCTARLRDLRKIEYGSYTISIRKRYGTKSFEYRLEK